MFRTYIAAALAAGASLVSARACVPRDSCEFGSAKSPACWGEYNLQTDWYETGPTTGVVREHWWNIVEGDISPDGIPRPALTVNGTFPGPTIEADWGDEIVVHVTNSAIRNGTSIHWHGIRQNMTNADDGVASITQCPSHPGSTVTYRWKATQYGSSWYHSHFSLQAWNGVFGMIKVNGSASFPYDEDVGPVALSDWYHDGVDSLWQEAQTTGAPVIPNGLLNGMNVFTNPDTNVTTGARWETVFASDKSYRLRFVNTAIDTHFKVSLDGHHMTVMAADFSPIEPYTTNVLSIGIGQRYDVVIEAGQQTQGDWWLRAVPQYACSAQHANGDNIMGIVRYDGSSAAADPTSETWDLGEDSCADEPLASLVPAKKLDAGQKDQSEEFSLGLLLPEGHFRWILNGNSFMSDWGYPTVQQIIDGNFTYTDEQIVVDIPDANKWFYLVIQNSFALAHPIHLHGHDFYVLGQAADATFDATDASQLNLANPPRRDVAMLPNSGYLVLDFYTDNPGVWLLHCHIGWHTSEGLALQIVERASEIPSLYESGTATGMMLEDTGSKWNAWETATRVVQGDSGVYV